MWRKRPRENNLEKIDAGPMNDNIIYSINITLLLLLFDRMEDAEVPRIKNVPINVGNVTGKWLVDLNVLSAILY